MIPEFKTNWFETVSILLCVVPNFKFLYRLILYRIFEIILHMCNTFVDITDYLKSKASSKSH